MQLSTSLVLYRTDVDQLDRTLASLATAVGCLQSREYVDFVLQIVDNSVDREVRTRLERFIDEAKKKYLVLNLRLVVAAENLGYGRANNLAISDVQSDFHLVINPDVIVDRMALAEALDFMRHNDDVGLLLPDVHNALGQRSFLCKRYPSVLDLLLRGFAPAPLLAVFRRRLGRYEMRDKVDGRQVCETEIGSGCFMLFRTGVLKKIGGFDSRYFLYFEDFDICLRLARHARIVYVPTVKIVHAGGYAARKGLRHIFLFVRSGIAFFRAHGWRWL